MSTQQTYDPSKEIPTLEQIILTPISALSPKALEDLKARRKYLADLFFNQATPFKDKLKIQDELAKLHKYLGYKEIKKLGEKTPTTDEQRKKNCDAFISYCGKTRWETLTPFEQAQVLAVIWGSVKS